MMKKLSQLISFAVLEFGIWFSVAAGSGFFPWSPLYEPDGVLGAVWSFIVPVLLIALLLRIITACYFRFGKSYIFPAVAAILFQLCFCGDNYIAFGLVFLAVLSLLLPFFDFSYDSYSQIDKDIYNFFQKENALGPLKVALKILLPIIAFAGLEWGMFGSICVRLSYYEWSPLGYEPFGLQGVIELLIVIPLLAIIFILRIIMVWKMKLSVIYLLSAATALFLQIFRRGTETQVIVWSGLMAILMLATPVIDIYCFFRYKNKRRS